MGGEDHYQAEDHEEAQHPAKGGGKKHQEIYQTISQETSERDQGVLR